MQADNGNFNKVVTLSRKAYASIGVPSLRSQGCEGINIVVELHLRGHINAKTDLVVNLTDVETVLMQVVDQLDHKNISTDILEFTNQSVSPKSVAEYILRQCQAGWVFQDVHIQGVTLYWGAALKVSVWV